MNYPFTYKDRTFIIEPKEVGGMKQWNILENGQLLSFVFDHEMVPQVIYEMVEFPRYAETAHSRYD